MYYNHKFVESLGGAKGTLQKRSLALREPAGLEVLEAVEYVWILLRELLRNALALNGLVDAVFLLQIFLHSRLLRLEIGLDPAQFFFFFFHCDLFFSFQLVQRLGELLDLLVQVSNARVLGACALV